MSLATRVALLVTLFATLTAAAQEPDPFAPKRRGAIVRPPSTKKPKTPACELELGLRERRDATGIILTFEASNRTKRPLELALGSSCARPPVTLTGLPPNADPFSTCHAGPCIAPSSTRITIAPRATATIARGLLPSLADPCNAPLPPGNHTLGFGLVFSGPAPVTCGPAPLKVAGFARPETRTQQQTPTPPPPQGRPIAKCPPMPECGLGCPNGGGFAHDENGCTLCACEDLRPRAPGVTRE